MAKKQEAQKKRQCDRGYNRGYRKLCVGSTSPQTCKNYCVYRYTDIENGIVKYVGIVKTGLLCDRLQSHEREEEWCKGKPWYIEFFECNNRSEVEAFEAHLIALYGTHKYFNKQKADWGLNQYLPNVENRWKPATIPICDNLQTMKIVYEVKKALKNKNPKIAEALIDLIEINFEGVE